MVLSACAQWEINQPPRLRRERASLEGVLNWLVLVRRAHDGTDPGHPLGGTKQARKDHFKGGAS